MGAPTERRGARAAYGLRGEVLFHVLERPDVAWGSGDGGKAWGEMKKVPGKVLWTRPWGTASTDLDPPVSWLHRIRLSSLICMPSNTAMSPVVVGGVGRGGGVG